MTATHKTLSIPGLETAYDAPATAINQAGTEKTERFLVKLALLNAHTMDNAELFQQNLQSALLDL